MMGRGGGREDFLARIIIVSRDAVMKTGSELRSPFLFVYERELLLLGRVFWVLRLKLFFSVRFLHFNNNFFQVANWGDFVLRMMKWDWWLKETEEAITYMYRYI